MKTISIKAYAKTNISLNVARKREDGYHELEMIMVPLSLADTIHITVAQTDYYTCSDPTLTMDASNTVVKAVTLMREKFKIQDHFHIHVEKHIPAQAGLAGGSADGAAILRGLHSLYNLPISIPQLAYLGVQIGADVPFCVYQTTAVVKGIGEIIEPFTSTCNFKVLLVKPPIGISTPVAFKRLNLNACDHPDVDQVKACLVENRFEDLASCIGNSLEYSAYKMEPMIAQIKQDLKAMGFTAVLMSGSGSTVFALSQNDSLLDTAVKTFQARGMFACKTEIVK